MIIDSLFPTDVLRDVNVLKQEQLKELSDLISDERQCLDLNYAPLRDKVFHVINEYFSLVNIEPPSLDMVSMWGNTMKPGECHRPHNHGNSYYSGVFYVSAEPDSPPIEFFDPRVRAGQMPVVNQYNPHNAGSWHYPSVPNTLIIFPSYLYHWVPTNESKHNRVSVSFNIVLRGTLGVKNELTEATW